MNTTLTRFVPWPKLVFLLLLIGALGATPAPQVASSVPALGPATYELERQDGSPIVPGETWNVVAVPLLGAPGTYMLLTYRKVGSEIPVLQAGESGIAIKTPTGYRTTFGENKTSSVVMGEDGRWEETVIQGSNPGRKTYWNAE